MKKNVFSFCKPIMILFLFLGGRERKVKSLFLVYHIIFPDFDVFVTVLSTSDLTKRPKRMKFIIIITTFEKNIRT